MAGWQNEWGSFRLRVNVESSRSAWEGHVWGRMSGSEGVGAHGLSKA